MTDGELKTADSIKFNDSLKYTTPKGKTVYGGGGIMPDVFIPIDTVGATTFFSNLSAQGVIYQFSFNYVDKNRTALKAKYKDAKSFVNNFEVTPEILDELFEIASSKGVKRDNEQISISLNIIKTQVKSLIGRNTFGSEAFYPVIFKIDETYLKAIDIIKKM